MSEKNMEYYWSLNYPVEIRRNPEHGGYFAFHPDLEGCMAEGGTPGETLRNLDDSRELWIEARLESGFPVPEPSVDGPSGKISLRMTPSLHADLARLASRQGVSLNLLINTVLAQYAGGITYKDEMEKARSTLNETIHRLSDAVIMDESYRRRIRVRWPVDFETRTFYGTTYRIRSARLPAAEQPMLEMPQSHEIWMSKTPEAVEA